MRVVRTDVPTDQPLPTTRIRANGTVEHGAAIDDTPPRCAIVNDNIAPKRYTEGPREALALSLRDFHAPERVDAQQVLDAASVDPRARLAAELADAWRGGVR